MCSRPCWPAAPRCRLHSRARSSSACKRALPPPRRRGEAGARTACVRLRPPPAPPPGTGRVSRHCDELLLLADAQAEPAIHPIEENCLLRRAPLAEAAEILVLLHPE